MEFLFSERKVWPDVKGIYCIKDKLGRNLVGQTVRGTKTRWSNHLQLLRKKKHENKLLQNRYNKYGESFFYFMVLETCELDNLNEKECFWIKKLKSMYNENGYNIREGGYSIKMSDSTKRKISKLFKGITRPHMPRHFKFINPDNQEINIFNLKKFCRDNNLNYRKMMAVHRKERNHHKYWTRHAKPIFRLSSANKIYEFTNLKKFCYINNLNCQYIRKVLTGKTKNYKGWVLANDSFVC